MKILIAYATKHQSTAEIATKIAEEIRTIGIDIDLMPVGTVINPAKYDVFIIGSAVYMGQWMNSAADFLITYEKLLTERPTWLFSSGPTGDGKPSALLKGFRFPAVLQDLAKRIEPEDIMLFHGKLDTEELGWSERIIVRTVRATIGDYRDWDSITEWAKSIQERLKSQQKA